MSNHLIKTAYLEAARKISIKETESPNPGTGEVLIKPVFTAICGSDVSFFEGHRIPPAYPIVLGHEVVGEVIAAASDVKNIKVGQRVIVEPNYPCGACVFCRTGRGNICPNKISLGVTIPGCYAEQFIAPAEFCWLIPESVSNEDAVTIEPLTVSLHALWQSGVQLGNTIAVLGCGSTGLLLIHAAVSQGVRVIAHDKIKSKLDMAHHLGAKIGDSKEISTLWGNENVNTVFECAGSSATVELALSAAPRGSQIILMGLSTSMASFQPLRFVREGLRIYGSLIYHHPSDFKKAIDIVEKKILTPKLIISDFFPFNKIQEAFQVAIGGEARKVLLNMRE